ncbi:MAG: hypothetical protein ABI658_10390 [Acidimicrobiales bacterium]
MGQRARRRRTSLPFLALTVALSVAASLAPTLSDAVAAPAPPVVHCAWAFVDANAATAAMDYGAVDVPAATPPTPACTYGAVTKQVTQSPNAQGLVQIVREGVAPRSIEVWAVVSDPTSDAFANGSGTVRWEVVGPNGGAPAVVQPTGRTCSGTTEPGAMWQWASTEATGSHALAAAAVTNADRRGLWERCRQGAVRIFTGKFDLTTNALSCGAHRVTAIATVGALHDDVAFTVNVLCPVNVVLDATQISWVVDAGKASTVTGDADPATRNAPTLTNRGTRPAHIGILFTPMTRLDDQRTVDQFSVTVQTATGGPSKAERFLAGDPVWLEQDGFTLCPGESALLSMTLHAGAQLVNGNYTGRVSILAREADRC